MHFNRQTTLKDFQDILFNMTQNVLNNEKDIRFANLEDYFKTGIESAKLSNIEENLQFYKELQSKLLAIEEPWFDKECITILFRELEPPPQPAPPEGNSLGSPDSGSANPNSGGTGNVEAVNAGAVAGVIPEERPGGSGNPSHSNLDQSESKFGQNPSTSNIENAV